MKFVFNYLQNPYKDVSVHKDEYYVLLHAFLISKIFSRKILSFCHNHGSETKSCVKFVISDLENIDRDISHAHVNWKTKFHFSRHFWAPS